MKRTLTLTLFFSLIGLLAIAQTVPQGMNYQAVARDADGNVLTNTDLTLEVILGTNWEGSKLLYQEYHKVTTNAFGLFSLTIGQGEALKGDFRRVPWSEDEIWLRVGMRLDGSSAFLPVSSTKMLSVPYAFHAGTADALAGETGGQRDNQPGVNSQTWSLFGNSNSDPTEDKLGTTDDADLSIVTDNEERVRIKANGDVDIHNNLDVGKGIDLNTTEGNTTVNGDLTVANMSSTNLTGTLEVDKTLTVNGSTWLNDSLTVQNEAPTLLTGDLKVLGTSQFGKEVSIEGALYLQDSLSVLNMAPTYLSGKLDVDKEATFNSTVSISDENAGFVATIENTQNGNGDGLLIKLGKTHPRWMDNPPPPFSNQVSAQIPGFTFLNQAVMSTKDLIKGLMTSPEETFSVENFEVIGTELLNAMEAELGGSLEDYASAACNLTNDLIGEINGALGLPYDDFSSIHIPGLPVVPYIEFLDIGPYGTPATNINTGFPAIPAIPSINCPAPPMLSDFSLPNFRITDVPNSLTTQNEYIKFVDKDGRQVGSIRAESIDDWCNRYLDLTYFLNVFNSFAGVTVIGLDPTQIAETLGKYAINGLAQIANVAAAYNSIGVEYSSGFGDYAEWLERVDAAEVITPGDIVGVVGGKITRKLAGSEQVMAVSSNPIVLGNIPPEGQDYLGNKVAFMGQIPVKVMGNVETGDYIVGASEIPGYGIARKPTEMTPEDFAFAVGRAWESFPGPGPKMVNTVVGVHNGDYLHILNRYNEQLQRADARLNAVEAKVEMLMPLVQLQSNAQ